MKPAANTAEAASWITAGEAKRDGATSMILSPGFRYVGLIEIILVGVKLMSLGAVRYFWGSEF